VSLPGQALMQRHSNSSYAQVACNSNSSAIPGTSLFNGTFNFGFVHHFKIFKKLLNERVIANDSHSEHGVHWTLRIVHVEARSTAVDELCSALETSPNVNTRLGRAGQVG
jgi:hypothetical protein